MYPKRRFRPASSFANRSFIFTILTIAIFGTKSVRIYSRLPFLSVSDVFFWGLSFYAQDVLFLLFLRFLFGKPYTTVRWLRLVLTATVLVATAALLSMAAMSISFFAVTGSEMHWHNISVISDFSAIKMMWTAGYRSFAMVLASILLLSWLLQDSCYHAGGLVVSIISWCLLSPLRNLSAQRSTVKSTTEFWDSVEDEIEYGTDTSDVCQVSTSTGRRVLRIVVGTALLALLSMVLIYPNESALRSLTWTLALMPVGDFVHLSTNLPGLPLLNWNTMDLRRQNLTALREPPLFPWLPSGANLSGFEDWYKPGGQHYHSGADPLRISNLDDEVVPALRAALADIDIRHVMVVILESTRSDVFPVKMDGLISKRLADSFPGNVLPEEPRDRLAELTPTANFLTGEYDDGTEIREKLGRGGIRAQNAFPTGTYTLKSLLGTLCGIAPLVVDFNLEVSHHIYQPCLPHILEAFNQLDHSGDVPGGGFTSFKWKSSFVQSVTGRFDHQDRLMSAIGYANDSVITKEYLRGKHAKFGRVNVPDNNYYGMPEVVLEDYIRDAFSMATRNEERVFLTHLTSTTHHPFEIPKYEEDEGDDSPPLRKREGLNQLSKYLNTIGYVDQWLGTILDILDEQGVADETLLVVVGDHGLSIAENDSDTPYDNPNIGNFHIPLVLSHPKLPQIDIKDAVTSIQLLPTILDLLLESNSLSTSEGRGANDLLRNYEGQSLLRPQMNASRHTGQANWQFTLVNPGGAMIAVRDARQPNWRLIVPLMPATLWRFTDLSLDPHEQHPIRTAGLPKLLKKARIKHGNDSSQWIEEAVAVTGWWIEENHRRWRYNPS
jgi:hypothetical protein